MHFLGLRNNERGRVSLNFDLQRDRILRQTELDTDDTERSHFPEAPYSDLSRGWRR